MTGKSIPEEVAAIKFVAETKATLAEMFGLPIIGTEDYFKGDDHVEMSKQLRELQLFLNSIVSAHDNLADATGNDRLVGKRGRKGGSTSKPTTVDDVVARLSK